MNVSVCPITYIFRGERQVDYLRGEESVWIRLIFGHKEGVQSKCIFHICIIIFCFVCVKSRGSQTVRAKDHLCGRTISKDPLIIKTIKHMLATVCIL